MLAGGVEESQAEIAQALRALHAREVGHVEQPHPGGLLPRLECLVGDSQHVAREAEGIAARDTRSRRGKLVQEGRGFRIGDVDDAQARLLPFVREIEDPPAIALLDGHPLAAIAVAAQLMMGDEVHRFRLCVGTSSNGRRRGRRNRGADGASPLLDKLHGGPSLTHDAASVDRIPPRPSTA